MSQRPGVAQATRVVVKVGSSSLTATGVGLDGAAVDAVVDTLSAARDSGRLVVLVSSGAIAAGLVPLGLTRRPKDLATLQAAAAVGQGLLIERYATSFARYGLQVGQVLLTVDDVVRRAHYRNARTTLDRLLSLGVVPVVNENDTVATGEIRFGDNDRLAALVAQLVSADLLVLASDVDGLYDTDPREPGARRIARVSRPQDLLAVRAGSSASAVGTGGMATKLEAARIATSSGTTVVLTAARDLAGALAGEEVGTLFDATGSRTASRLLWLAHASAALGRVVLDEGAVAAVVERRASLLAAGVTAVSGEFAAGDPVELVDLAGGTVARGLVGYDSAELSAILGRSSSELGPDQQREVVHRDDLVLLR